MKKKAIILACLVASILPSFARIGETSEELKARYGDPIETKGDVMSFKKGAVEILATLWKGKCHSLFLKRKVDFTPAEIELLLAGNGGGSEWAGEKQLFETADKKRSACLISPSMLLIQTAEYKEHKEAERVTKDYDKAFEGK